MTEALITDKVVSFFFYLSSIDRDGAGHHSLQVTAETDSLHGDDGFLGQNGSGVKAKWIKKTETSQVSTVTYISAKEHLLVFVFRVRLVG